MRLPKEDVLRIAIVKELIGKTVPVTAFTLSKNLDSSVSFTARIISQLVKENVIIAKKGPKGGFLPSPMLDTVSVGDVVRLNLLDSDNPLERAIGRTIRKSLLNLPIASLPTFFNDGLDISLVGLVGAKIEAKTI